MMLRGLTIHQPWAWAIVAGYKHIENRTWEPPRSMIGHWLAIHASRTVDWTAVPHRILAIIRQATLLHVRMPTEAVDVTGAILGVARLVEVVTRSDSPWFDGPYGWVLDTITRFAAPIPAKGSRGIWTLDGDQLDACRVAFKEEKRRERQARAHRAGQSPANLHRQQRQLHREAFPPHLENGVSRGRQGADSPRR